MSPTEAATAIEGHRNDLSRQGVSDDLWEILARKMLAQGYDREAYEYSLSLPQRSPTSLPTQAAIPQGTSIVKLEGPLDSAERIQEIANLPTLPPTSNGRNEDSADATFCEIDGLTRHRLLLWLSEHHRTFRPTIIRLAKAKKDLSATSVAPSLGIDATLPQHRPHLKSTNEIRPLQEEYPVWYFFYGTLVDPAILSQHLNLQPETPRQMVPAFIERGRVKIWGGKYRALVDDFHAQSRVTGCAFLVQTKEEEDGLRFYEGKRYEVVRCEIFFDDEVGGSVFGLTFRFAGDERELERCLPTQILGE